MNLGIKMEVFFFPGEGCLLKLSNPHKSVRCLAILGSFSDVRVVSNINAASFMLQPKLVQKSSQSNETASDRLQGSILQRELPRVALRATP